MPLLDHFHPPLSTNRHWEAFHARWASAIADALNECLPDGYFAEAQVHAGPRIEIDVAAFEQQPTADAAGSAVALQIRPAATLAPPELILPAAFPPEFAVQVFENSAGPALVAAVELVSPANKDRDRNRRAFAVKCAAYLQRGLGLVVVDVVTNRLASPLADLLTLLEYTQPQPDPGALTAVSYRPVRMAENDTIELRIRSLAINEPLPELPLAIDGGRVVSIDLEASYQDARERSRL